MQIQQLIYFMKITDLGSMNKVAEALFTIQPNLSRAIMNLKSELDIEIFKRNNKGAIMTENGKRLYQYSKAILNQMDFIKGMALREDTPILSIASYSLVSISRLLCEIYNDHKDKDIKTQLLERRLRHVIETVESNEAELGFLMYNDIQGKEIRYMLRYKHIELNYLGTDTWYVNVDPYSPLFDKEGVDAAELLCYPVVGISGDYFSSLTFYLSIDDIPLAEFKKVEYISDNAAMLNLPKYTDVFRFGPGINREDFAVHGIKIIPIKNCGVTISVAWVRRKKEILDASAQESMQMLEKWVPEAIR